jgi:hypothetical protein
MTVLVLDSEVFSPRGNVSSEGVRNQLGRPHLDPWTVLIREAVQNCWDARLGTAQVHVRLDLKELSPIGLQALETYVFHEEAPGIPVKQRLAEARAGKPITILTVADYGTTGLDGPTRAGTPADGRFVGFLRNVGQPPRRAHGGGTFGFGKAAFYLLSALRTIIVHTHCRSEGRPEKRFIVAALGDEIEHRGRRLTGRHWWGQAGTDPVEPAVGATAEAFAGFTGCPQRRGEETGTTITILDVDRRDRTLEDLGGLLIEILLWNFWPKMVAPPGGVAPMRFSCSVGGKEVPVPDPARFPPLDGFVQALQEIDQARGSAHQVQGFRRVDRLKFSHKVYGMLALQKFGLKPRQPLHRLEEVASGGISGDTCHHVALLRAPRLVVRYLPTEPLAQAGTGYAGVALISDDQDGLMARAEPPTHDDWIAEQLPTPDEQRIVRGLLKNIAKAAADFVEPLEQAPVVGSDESVIELATHIGELLMSTSTERAPRPVKTSKATIEDASPRPKPSSETVSPVDEDDAVPPDSARLKVTPRVRPIPLPKLSKFASELMEYEGQGAVRLHFEVKKAPRAEGFRVTAEVLVCLEDGQVEDTPPLGAEVPTLLGWLDSQGTMVVEGSRPLELRNVSVWSGSALVRVVDDACLKPRLAATSIEPSVEVPA